ncbi:MAG: trypsin-like serine peptidase [Gammaproteobacteria bacterium]
MDRTPTQYAVSILDSRGPADAPRCVGSGILLDDRTVLTCAHVVGTALGIDSSLSEAPKGTVSLSFPMTDGAPDRCFEAVVDPGSWFPERRRASKRRLEDMAVLRLQQPLPLSVPAPRWAAWDADEYGRRPFEAFGYGESQGLTVEGSCQRGTTRGWIQLTPDVGDVLDGHSGGPVWSSRSDGSDWRFIGMLVARRTRGKAAYLIPARFMADHCADIRVDGGNATHNEDLAEWLSMTVDRVDQCGAIVDDLKENPGKHRCYAFYGRSADLPPNLGKHVLLMPHLDASETPPQGDPMTRFHLLRDLYGDGFNLEQALRKKFGDVSHWLRHNSGDYVLFCHVHRSSQVGELLSDLGAQLAALPQPAGGGRFLLLAACAYTRPWLRWLPTKPPSAMHIDGVVSLKPLPPVCGHDLSDWVGELPHDLERKFNTAGLREAFSKILSGQATRRYARLVTPIKKALIEHQI